MPRIKILHVISSLKTGGAEQVLFNILDRLKDDFEHQVIYFHDGPFKEKIENLGIKTTQISGLICNYDPLFIYRFIKKIVSFRPVLISSSLWSANILSRIIGKLFKIPVINAIHALPQFEGRFRNFIDKRTLNLASKIISVSENITDIILANNLSLKNKIITIKNGVNLEELEYKFKTYGLTKKDLNLQSHFVIGTVGRFIKAKNQDLLIKAFKKINIKYPHSRLIIVGIGTEEQSLKDLISTLNLEDKIKLIIAQPAYKYLPAFDCFILPSKLEGLSLALLEAMAAHLPVITTGIITPLATQIIINHEIIINNQNGLVIRPNSIEQIISSIETLILNKELTQKLAQKGYNTIKTDLKSSIMSQKYKIEFDKFINS